jgi:hypothetical protein
MDSLLRDFYAGGMQRVHADSGAIWILDRDSSRLVVAHTHPVEELMGMEQPLDEGLISLVIASEQGICENQVYKNAQHSKAIDAQVGRVTCGMIAVPLYFGGVLRGVISGVRWKTDPDHPDPAGFTAGDLGKFKLLSLAYERMINFQLVRIILDLHL